MYNCINCHHANWFSKTHGECLYPMPAVVQKRQFKLGVWSKKSDGTYGHDYTKVGAVYDDKSVIEIKICYCWKRNKTGHTANE